MKKQEVAAKSATVIPTPVFSLLTPIESIKCWYSEKIGTKDKLFVIKFRRGLPTSLKLPPIKYHNKHTSERAVISNLFENNALKLE